MLNGSRVLCGILLAAVPGAAPAAAQSIRGRVVDRVSGAAVAGARVLLSGGGGTSSGLDGRFELVATTSGRARLRVSRAGYHPATRVIATAAAAEEVVIRLNAQGVALDRLLVPIPRRRLSLAGSFRTIAADETPVPLTLTSGRHTLRVTGTVEVPDACHALRAAAERLEGELVVIVEARGKRACRSTGPARLGYRLTVRRLRPGSYLLRVMHQLPDDAEREVYSSPVEVR